MTRSSIGDALLTNMEETTLVPIQFAFELAAEGNIDAFRFDHLPGQALLVNATALTFTCRRMCPLPSSVEKRQAHLLTLVCMALIAQQNEAFWDIVREIEEDERFYNDSPNIAWELHVWQELFICWIKLMKGHDIRSIKDVLNIVQQLRKNQAGEEAKMLSALNQHHRRAAALRLLALYYFAAATEKFAEWLLTGEASMVDAIASFFSSAAEVAKIETDIEDWLFRMIRWCRAYAEYRIALVMRESTD